MLGAQTAKTERAKVELCGPARPELELPLRDLQCSVITNCLLSKKKDASLCRLQTLALLFMSFYSILC